MKQVISRIMSTYARKPIVTKVMRLVIVLMFIILLVMCGLSVFPQCMLSHRQVA